MISGFRFIDDDFADPEVGISTATSLAKNVLTFAFVDGGNQGGGDNTRDQLPSYYQPGSEQFAANAAGTLKGLSQEQREAVREVYEYYESLINVKFVELPFPSVETDAEIVIGAYPVGGGNGSLTFLPDTNGNGLGNEGGDNWFDTGRASTSTRTRPLTSAWEVHFGTKFLQPPRSPWG